MVDSFRQVALLRGINVGRAKRVGMAQLRELLRGLGYTDVTTYLQSGNAIFTSPPGAAGIAAGDIELALDRNLGVEAKVIVRSHAELAAAVAADPLLDVATDPSKHFVAFLAGDPDPAGVRTVACFDFAPDQVRLVGREAHLWCPSGFLASPLSKVPWDKLLGVSVTMRNWNTVTKLLALSGT
jgi:uncharacterized protein (DUF1697 family)